MDTDFNSAYFKRFRMEIASGTAVPAPALPDGYRLVPWHDGLLDAHARTKFRSFRGEIDAVVFPCLGDLDGCRRLMREIRGKAGFLPSASWLVARSVRRADPTDARPAEVEWCGTIQGVVDSGGNGSIQNIGVVPCHRGFGLATSLIVQALAGFLAEGVPRVALEVTADNARAVRLYRKLGFRRVRTLYKVVDRPAWTSLEREPAFL
jgi:ribosomal protein S18 acetylase RimI-like enzyme